MVIYYGVPRKQIQPLHIHTEIAQLNKRMADSGSQVSQLEWAVMNK